MVASRDIFKEALDLEEKDRAELAGLLIESLEMEVDEAVAESWKAEIERRLASIDNGEVELIPWEEVRDRLQSRLNANN